MQEHNFDYSKVVEAADRIYEAIHPNYERKAGAYFDIYETDIGEMLKDIAVMLFYSDIFIPTRDEDVDLIKEYTRARWKLIF